MDKWIEKIAAVAVVLVVLLVLLGLLRLAIDNWGYVLLLVAAIGGAFYLFKQSK
jgi:hypothetical protein